MLSLFSLKSVGEKGKGAYFWCIFQKIVYHIGSCIKKQKLVYRVQFTGTAFS